MERARERERERARERERERERNKGITYTRKTHKMSNNVISSLSMQTASKPIIVSVHLSAKMFGIHVKRFYGRVRFGFVADVIVIQAAESAERDET